MSSVIRESFESYRITLEANQHIASEVFEDWPNILEQLISILQQNAKTAGKQSQHYLIDGPLEVIEMLVIDCGKAISLLDNECANVIDALLFFAPNKDYLPQTRVGAIRSLEYLYHHQPIVFSPKMQNYCKVKSLKT